MRMNKKGSILMICLWITAVLAVFAVGLGYRASIDLRLSRYQRDRLKANCLAKAGIQMAILELEDDTNDYDSLSERWSAGVDPLTNKKLLENIELEEGSGEAFTVKYKYDENTYLCMQDEGRKININKDAAPLALLTELLKYAGMEGSEAQEAASYIRAWRGDPAGTPPDTFHPDLEIYSGFKKKELSRIEELMLVLELFYKDKGEKDYRDKAGEIFRKLSGQITIYGDNKININTVSKNALTSLAASLATGTQVDYIDSLVEKIINGREALPKKAFEDTAAIASQAAISPPDEENLWNAITGSIKLKSDYFRIESAGSAAGLTKNLTAIYDRNNEKIVYWHEN